MGIELLDDIVEVADQCRMLGLEIGDTIVGREEGPRGRWHEAELTLLWIGQQAAVFRVRERTDTRPRWSEPRESGDWTLECRDWYEVPNACGEPGHD